jgi:hypothetical protein
MILNPIGIYNALYPHITNLSSAPFACNRDAAFESWFRVELYPVLLAVGFLPGQISPNYNYQSAPRIKADLISSDGIDRNIFETKSFVKNADGNKRPAFTNQLNKLLTELQKHYVDQIIAIATFQGYTVKQMNKWHNRLAIWAPHRRGWQHMGPRVLAQPFRLQIWIATNP